MSIGSPMRMSESLGLFRSFKGWSIKNLSSDIVAGLTLAAIAVPEQMATAGLAGFSPAYGFYAFIAGSVAFAVFGASRFVSVGADSTIAPIFVGGLALFAASGSPTYTTLASTLALMVGAILVIGGLFRMGWIANLLSIPVTTGFLAGIAVHILVFQLPALFGVLGSGATVIQRVSSVAANLGHVNFYTLTLGVGVFLVTFICEKISSRIPGALVGLLLATLSVIAFHLEGQGVQTLGPIAGGLPKLMLPAVGVEDITLLIALAFIVSLVVMVQTAATTGAFVPKNADPPDVNRDFIGVGAGSLLAGLLGAFPVNSSPPRTAVAEESGGQSQATSLIAAALVAALIGFGPKLLTHVPSAALAGTLLFVAQRITRFSTMLQIYRRTIGEFALIVATMAAIVVLPIQIGVGIGIFLSLMHGVWTTTRTRIIELERLPGTSIWWPPSRASKGEKIDGIMVLAFQAPLSFLNAHDFRRDFLAATRSSSIPLKAVVLEASNIVEVDFTASQVLAQVIEGCRDTGVPLFIARLESTRAQQALERFGIIEVIGRDHIFPSVQGVIDNLNPAHSLATDERRTSP